MRRFSFVSNFKKLTFASLFSLRFSRKPPWCSSFRLKFEPYNLQHCKKNYCKLVFWVFTEHLLYHTSFGPLHCYEVTLVERCNIALLQKRETKIFDQKRSIKNSFKVNEKNNSGVLRINQIMSKCSQLNASKFRICLHCYIIFWNTEHFHISHFTYHLRYCIIIDHSWKLLTMF